MFSNAIEAYDSGVKATASIRDLEAAVLFKAARLLEACRQRWDATDRPARLAEALRHNQRLWTLFQSELMRTDQELPAELRVNLLRLSAFVDRRTFEILAQPEAQKLQVLIDINRNIAAGLSGHTP
jgi:flagellar protein FlaF